MNIPNLNVIRRLWNQRSGVAQRRLALKKEKIEEANMETHRVSVVVSDPNHTMQTMRKEKIQKRVKVQARDKDHAIDSALHHYKKAGYKVHDHHYIGKVNEEAELEEQSSNAHERGGADAYYGRRYNNPHKPGTQEHQDYHKGYHGAEHGQKDYGGSRGKPMHKFESFDLEEARGSADKHWDIAQGHKEKASSSSKGTESYHSHMASYHDSMHRYHSEIGQSSQASAHADKAEIHHEKAYEASRSVKEATDLRAQLRKHSEAAIAANKAGDDEKVKHHMNKMNAIKDKMTKQANESVELDEISQKLAGDYYGAVVKQQAKKTGLKPDLYHKLEPKRQKGIDRATDRLMTKEEIAANNVGSGNIAGTQGDAGKKAVMNKKPLKRFKDLMEK
jgi:hypothetical protein